MSALRKEPGDADGDPECAHRLSGHLHESPVRVSPGEAGIPRGADGVVRKQGAGNPPPYDLSVAHVGRCLVQSVYVHPSQPATKRLSPPAMTTCRGPGTEMTSAHTMSAHVGARCCSYRSELMSEHQSAPLDTCFAWWYPDCAQKPIHDSTAPAGADSQNDGGRI